MKKRIVLIIFICLYSLNLMAQGKEYPFENKTYHELSMMEISFNNGIFTYENLYQKFNVPRYEPKNFPRSDSGPYTIREENGYSILNVQFSENPRDIIIFYHDQQIILYDATYEEMIYGQIIDRDGAGLYFSQKIKGSSFLTETLGGICVSYPPSNLSNRELTLSWVEGAEGDGIGEELELLIGSNHLVVANGFFIQKTYLFIIKIIE